MIDLALIAAGGAFAISATAATGFLIAPRTALPLAVRFVLGGACLSIAIFLLLAEGLGFRPLFLLGGAALIVSGFRVAFHNAPPRVAELPRMPVLYRAILGTALLIYLIYAIAPEIQPDAAGFHLGLVAEYVRTHSLTRRVGFYELMPQPVEMLFVPAFMIGAHSAAKLVSFAFLITTIPLFRRIARELNLSDGAASAAAALFVLSPITGVVGTAAYTDLAQVCASATVLYLLLRWKRERTDPILALAGTAAGFCYTVKPTFGLIALAGIVYVASKTRRAGPVLVFGGGAAIVAMPWVLRSGLLTGNPFAPLLSAWFPNAGIPAGTDRALLDLFSVFAPTFSWRWAWPDYTVFGGQQGLLGPVYLLVPLALFALRSKAGRILLATALLFALPVIPNAGTRFLMPAMVPATLAFSSLLSAPVAAGLVAVQAVGALRPVIRLYDIHGDLMLPELPLRAALRIEPERDYLRRVDWVYRVDEMMVAHSEPDARIFAFGPYTLGYVPREVLDFWHSTIARQVTDNLLLALHSPDNPAARIALPFEPGQYDAFRITARKDVKLLDTRPTPSPSKVWPAKVFEAGETWVAPVEPNATRLNLLLYSFEPSSLGIEARAGAGGWKPVATPITGRGVPVDLRRRVTSDVLARGYRYVLVSTGSDSYSEIGRDMERHPSEWGVSLAGRERDIVLFRISRSDPATAVRGIEPGEPADWDREPAPVVPVADESTATNCDPAMIDDTSGRIAYRGSWTVFRQFGKACGGTLTFSANGGDSATFSFEGTGVTLVFTGASNRGRAKVWIDDRDRGVVDEYWPCRKEEPGCLAIRWHRQTHFGALASGTHTVRIQVLHENSPRSQGYDVDVDGFIVH